MIERPEVVRIEGMDEKGEMREFEFRGLLARAAKHEIDHLDGRLLVDYLSKLRLRFIEKRLNAIREMQR